MSTYRIVHFVPDPFSGLRLPVAAIVESSAGVEVVRSPRKWPLACLGSRRERALLQTILQKLHAPFSIDSLPETLGPSAVLDQKMTMPDYATEPSEWVLRHVLSQRQAKKTRPPSSEGRLLQGRAFLKRERVADLVQDKFQPATAWDGWLHRAEALPAVSLWVEGRSEALLLEPIILQRAKYLQETNTVAVNFGAYQQAIARVAKDNRQAKLIAYIVSDEEHQELFDAVKERLDPFADEVINTSKTDQRHELVNLIETIADRPAA